MKDLNGLPFRAGGGRDWRQTLATMRGWVQIVARALEQAPRTDGRGLRSVNGGWDI